MHISKDVSHILAEHVYNNVKAIHEVAAPEMLAWSTLSDQQRSQCAKAMQMWLGGLGSNEVVDAWYARSGFFPTSIWEQIPGGSSPTSFAFAALDLISWLIAAAELYYEGKGPTPFSEEALIEKQLEQKGKG